MAKGLGTMFPGYEITNPTLIEAAIVTVVIGSFYFGTILFQNWENGRFAEWAGKDVTINGYFDSQGDSGAQAAAYNIDLSNLDVYVTVAHLNPDGTLGAPVPTLVWDGSCHQIPAPGVRYGDYVAVVVTSAVNIPVLSAFMSDKSSSPAASGNWHGIAQLDSSATAPPAACP